ncbi:MAG: sulfotransferase [Solirubrobacteraceae bacterium]
MGPEPAGAVQPKVVYVMGAGRCGSTILGIALGNCEGMFFVGELDRWLPNDGRPMLGGAERTRFWSEVRAHVEIEPQLAGTRAKDLIERSSTLLRVTRLRARRRLRPRYRRSLQRLYEALSARSGAAYVVESSHFPLRARELQQLAGVESYLLFLVRDPRSSIVSFTRTVPRHDAAARRKRILTTNLDLWATHMLGTFVFLRHPRERRLFMRYEDLVSDPQGVLRQVLQMVGSSAALPPLQELRTGLAIDGNRILLDETVALRAHRPAPVRGSRLTELLQLPLSAVLARLRPAAGAAPR